LIFYDEGSDLAVIFVAVLTLVALAFQIWSKYDERKNPDKYSFDWKSVLEEE
tara:strand:- start:47 stop:202 length:156 start_codon:yes stop_codon:yes gene_type:complete